MSLLQEGVLEVNQAWQQEFTELTYTLLEGENSKTYGIGNLDLPITIQFTSAEVSRKIELSVDGTTFFTPTYDVTDDAFLVVAVLAPIKLFKVTGAADDVLFVLGA